MNLKDRLIQFCKEIIDSESQFINNLKHALKRPVTDKEVLNYKKRISERRLIEYQRLLKEIQNTSSIGYRSLENTIELDIKTCDKIITEWKISLENSKEPEDSVSVKPCKEWQDWRDTLRKIKQEVEKQPIVMGQYCI